MNIIIETNGRDNMRKLEKAGFFLNITRKISRIISADR